MTQQEIRDQLSYLINEIARIPRDRIADTATVDNELRMESVAFVELQIAIEDEYDIEIDPLRIVELNEFGAIVNYVHRRILSAEVNSCSVGDKFRP
ncbi:MAG: acyl carrier protein [Candidatus Binatia bacterium]